MRVKPGFFMVRDKRGLPRCRNLSLPFHWGISAMCLSLPAGPRVAITCNRGKKRPGNGNLTFPTHVKTDSPDCPISPVVESCAVTGLMIRCVHSLTPFRRTFGRSAPNVRIRSGRGNPLEQLSILGVSSGRRPPADRSAPFRTTFLNHRKQT